MRTNLPLIGRVHCHSRGTTPRHTTSLCLPVELSTSDYASEQLRTTSTRVPPDVLRNLVQFYFPDVPPHLLPLLDNIPLTFSFKLQDAEVDQYNYYLTIQILRPDTSPPELVSILRYIPVSIPAHCDPEPLTEQLAPLIGQIVAYTLALPSLPLPLGIGNYDGWNQLQPTNPLFYFYSLYYPEACFCYAPTSYLRLDEKPPYRTSFPKLTLQKTILLESTSPWETLLANLQQAQLQLTESAYNC